MTYLTRRDLSRLLPLMALKPARVMAETIDARYREEIEQWRQKREAALKADGGWLTVTGLFWLKEGPNTIGSDATNDILLPASAPAHLGVIEPEQFGFGWRCPGARGQRVTPHLGFARPLDLEAIQLRFVFAAESIQVILRHALHPFGQRLIQDVASLVWR